MTEDSEPKPVSAPEQEQATEVVTPRTSVTVDTGDHETIVSVKILWTDEKDRIDTILRKKLKYHFGNKLSRTKIQKLIKSGEVKLDDQPIKPSIKLKHGQTLVLRIANSLIHEKVADEDDDAEVELFDLKVLYEDDHIIVIDKPKGMKVFSKSTEKSPIAEAFGNSLVYRCSKNASLGDQDDSDSFYEEDVNEEGTTQLIEKDGQEQESGLGKMIIPGIVQKIEAQTSGALLISKTDRAYENMQAQFAQRKVDITYLCLAHGSQQRPNDRITSFWGRHPLIRTSFTALKDVSNMTREEMLSLAEDTKATIAATLWRRRGSFFLCDNEPEQNSANKITTPEITLFELRQNTNCVHQVRGHMQVLKNPILFDPMYRVNKGTRLEPGKPHSGNVTLTEQEEFLANKLRWSKLDLFPPHPPKKPQKPLNALGQVLHVSSLFFDHPITNAPMKVEAPLPTYFRQILGYLRPIRL